MFRRVAKVSWDKLPSLWITLGVLVGFGTSGTFAQVPSNDLCINAIPVSIGSVVQGDTTLANPAVQNVCGVQGNFIDGAVWYVVSGNGDFITATLCFDETSNIVSSTLRCYSGTCANLVCVGGTGGLCLGGGGTPAQFSFLSAPGVDYYLLVVGSGVNSFGVPGGFGLEITAQMPPPEDCANGIDDDFDGLLDCDDLIDCPTGVAPCSLVSNNECQDAIQAFEGNTPFDIALATTSNVPPLCNLSPGLPDIWFSYTATCDGFVFPSLQQPPSVAAIGGAFAGCGGSAICFINVPPLGIGFPVTAGTEYWIRIVLGPVSPTPSPLSGILTLSCNNTSLNSLTCANVTAEPGETVSIPVTLDNNGAIDISGYQFSLCCDPAVVMPTSIELGDSATVNGGSPANFVVLDVYPGGWVGSFVINFIGASVLPAGTQDFVVAVAVGEVLPTAPSGSSALELCGDLPYFIQNTVVLQGLNVPVPLLINGVLEVASAGPQFVRGDANADSQVDIGDPIAMLAGLFSLGPLQCLAAADPNSDTDVNIADPIYLLSFLFSSGTAPAAPFPGCGTAPNGVATAECDLPTCP